jgi:hypothetical protein
MRLRGKVDGNQPEIVKALRQIPHLTVVSTANLGGGFPDLAVGWMGQNHLFEVKATAKDQLTDDEETFHETWTGRVYVVTSADDVLRVLGIIARVPESMYPIAWSHDDDDDNAICE